MTPDRELSQAIWWVLQKIKYEISSKNSGTTYFSILGRPAAKGETLTEDAQQDALSKIEAWGGIKITRREIREGTYLNYIFSLEILQPKFDELYRSHKDSFNQADDEKQSATVNIPNKTSGGFYVIKKEDGFYYFDGNLVYFKSKNAQYAIIFDVAYSLKPQGGKMEYKKIIEQCKKRGQKNVDKKSILRALTGKDANLFKYVKEIKQEPAYGISLFVAMQDGKEIEFNNKK